MNKTTEMGFLSGSECRVYILNALRTEGPLTKRELEGECDASRITITRNLKALCAHGYVTETQGEYRLTCIGTLVSKKFFDLQQTLGLVEELQPFLEWVPEDEFDLDPRDLADAEVVAAKPTNYNAPIKRYVETLENATGHVRILLSVVELRSMETAAERLEGGDFKLEVVADPDVVETIHADTQYSDLIERMEGTGNLTKYVSSRSIPYFVTITDDSVVISVTDDDGIPRATVSSEAGAVRDWAVSTFESYRTDAEEWS